MVACERARLTRAIGKHDDTDKSSRLNGFRREVVREEFIMTDPVAQAIKHRHPKEWVFFGLGALLTVAVLLTLFLVAIFRTEVIEMLETNYIEGYRAQHPDMASLTDEEILPLLPADQQQVLDRVSLLYVPVAVLAPLGLFIWVVFSTGKLYGAQRAGAVRITGEQFPEVYEMWESMALAQGLKKVPELYTINGNGDLNAFASCVPGFRYFSSIYSDILETCLRNEDWDSLKFILGHELGHMRLGHVTWWYLLLTFPANLPFVNYVLGLPLSRSKEYSCDKIGHAIAQDDAYKGLLMLTAGKHLYDQLDTQAHIEESTEERGFWMAIANLFSSHPIVAWRINAVRKNHNGGIFFYRK